MQRAVWRVAADRLEQELDDVLPRLVDGVHERAIGDGGLIELVAYAVSGPLPHIDGARMEEVPDAWPERRRLHDRGVTIGGRVHLREPPDPSPKDPALIDVVVELSGAFGAGSHPTTRMCVELLLGVEPGGAFADLGCGAGALSIVAARLGYAPVLAVDVSPIAVSAATANAAANGVAIEARSADLAEERPPAARVAAANVPLEVHAAIADRMDVATVIVSGVHDAAGVAALYGRYSPSAALEESGWVAVRLDRT